MTRESPKSATWGTQRRVSLVLDTSRLQEEGNEACMQVSQCASVASVARLSSRGVQPAGSKHFNGSCAHVRCAALRCAHMLLQVRSPCRTWWRCRHSSAPAISWAAAQQGGGGAEDPVGTTV